MTSGPTAPQRSMSYTRRRRPRAQRGGPAIEVGNGTRRDLRACGDGLLVSHRRQCSAMRVVSAQVPPGHARPRVRGPGVAASGRLRTSCSSRGRFPGIFVLPDSDCQPARRSELGIGVAARGAQCREISDATNGCWSWADDCGQGRSARATVDEHRDPRAAQQDVGAPTAVPAGHRPVNDEPQAALAQGAAQSQFRAGAGSPGPAHHP
jgi:hypothetical protein